MKAIIPAAGLGTRLLPITKVVPKELLPVRGKPVVQWALEEAIDAGLREVVIVVSERKSMLREYLTPLETGHPLLDHPTMHELEQLLRQISISFVDQPAALGLADAVLCCREKIGDEPFALMLPDNVFVSAASSVTGRLVQLHARTQQSCVGLWKAHGAGLSDGAVVARETGRSTWTISKVFPKGDMASATTNLRPLGRAVLEPRAFELLESARSSGMTDEVPALNGLANEGRLLGLLVEEEFVHMAGW